MSNYKALVHYHFKKGMEEQGIKFLERELVKKAHQYGCHGIDLLQSEKDPTLLIGVGYWNTIEEARQFQAIWVVKEKELLKFCVDRPVREFYRLRNHFEEKLKKAA